jgi:predicted DsbA family dithiol-disulfide isomerase
VPVSIRLYSDFACPYCFLAEIVLKQAMAGEDVQVEFMPFELRPYPTPTLRPEGAFVQTAWRNSVAPLARNLGVDIRIPRLSSFPYTRLAFEGLEFSKDNGKSAEYYSRVMRGLFQESEDIGDPGVLARLASEAGLDAGEFRLALETHRYGGRVEELLRHAYQELQITGVPAFLIGSRLLTGLQSRETLVAAIAEAEEQG